MSQLCQILFCRSCCSVANCNAIFVRRTMQILNAKPIKIDKRETAYNPISISDGCGHLSCFIMWLKRRSQFSICNRCANFPNSVQFSWFPLYLLSISFELDLHSRIVMTHDNAFAGQNTLSKQIVLQSDGGSLIRKNWKLNFNSSKKSNTLHSRWQTPQCNDHVHARMNEMVLRFTFVRSFVGGMWTRNAYEMVFSWASFVHLSLNAQPPQYKLVTEFG